MSLRNVVGDVALASEVRGVGTYTSTPISVSGAVANVLVNSHVTAVAGTGPSLAVSLEQSNDGATWTAVPASAAPTLTAAGNDVSGAPVTQSWVRVVAAVTGTGATVTFSVAVLGFSA